VQSPQLRERALLSVAAFWALALGCSPILTEGGDDSDADSEGDSGDEGCLIGSLDCPCTAGGGCDPGLSCEAGVCADSDLTTETGGCTTLGCPCNEELDACDDGLICMAGSCETSNCGDAVLDPGETCDDGNFTDGDGCDADCTHTQILDIAAGGAHTCALIENGRVRCWGHAVAGQLGYGNLEDIGDDETPASAGDLPLPPNVVEIEAGGAHTCARFGDGSVRCWGFNTLGQLGYGNTAIQLAIGDDESLEDLPAIDVGGPVDQLVVGTLQSCVRASGQLRCWGAGSFGQLGLGSLQPIGDDEVPAQVDPVSLGGDPFDIATGGAHGCALTVGGGLRCWGRNDSGQLGQGSIANLGDDETPESAPDLSVVPPQLPPGTTVTSLALGLGHSCALLSTAEVLCWGENAVGQLGQGNVTRWGDQPGELPSALDPIQLGAGAVAIAAGYDHTCALLEDGSVRCWGDNSSGQLGVGDEEHIGDNELPAAGDLAVLGHSVIRLSAGAGHTCAVLDDQRVMCWGSNSFGQLGYGFTHSVGDDEYPETAGTIDLL